MTPLRSPAATAATAGRITRLRRSQGPGARRNFCGGVLRIFRHFGTNEEPSCDEAREIAEGGEVAYLYIWRRGSGVDFSACDGQALEKTENGNGRLLQEVGMDLGSAPDPFGVGAATERAVRLRGAARSSRAKLAIVKLGGSLANGPHLKGWLAAIAAEAGSIVVVPGGGPFADAVRRAQASMGFDDGAAHAMALMAMAQFGRALQSLNPAIRQTGSLAAISRALKAGKVPVWSPWPMMRTAVLPESWHLTSDSLAAWLAGALGADRLVLVKHGRFAGAAFDARDLAAQDVVDPLFPHYLGQSGARAWLATAADSARLAEGLRRPIFPEILALNEAAEYRTSTAE
jgi:5-(aminomethyl)-3-furanmethanol phosphate kinase